MKLYVADYHGDTTHLGALEHGAYLLLLMAMWRAGGRLPADDGRLSKLAKVSPDQWAEMRATILDFFRRRGGHLTHKRISEEMAKYETVSAKRKAASDLGVAEKRRKNSAKTEPNGSQGEDHLVAKPEPEPEPKSLSPSSAGEGAPDWAARLAEAMAAGSDGLDRTSTGLMHARDLRTLCEPTSGDPCEWGEVLDAIRVCSARAKVRGKPLRSWSWVREDALALRDKRLTAHLPKPEQRHERPHHDAKFDARQANLARHERGADIAARQPRWEP